MTKKAKKGKNIDGLIHLRIAEQNGTLNSLTRSLCNGDSPKANARAEKKAEHLVRTAQRIHSLIKERGELASATQGRKLELYPWEKITVPKPQ